MKDGLKEPYWIKRGGGFIHAQWGPIIKIKRRGPSSSSSARKVHSVERMLSDNAKARGYHNGVLIGKKVH